MADRKNFKEIKEEFKKEYNKAWEAEKAKQAQHQEEFKAQTYEKVTGFLMRHKFFTVLLVLIPIFLIALFVDSFIPSDIYDGTFYINPVNNIEFMSKSYDVGKYRVCVYACLNDDASLEGDDEFVITVAKLEGTLKNKYNIYTYSPQTDEEVLSPEYKYIVDFPTHEVKSGSRYYGSVYTGIAPADCESITIGGVEAEMERFTFDLNGKPADFYLYYCVIEQNEYPDELPVICRRTNGEQLSISSVDGEDAKVTVIGSVNADSE